MKSSLNYILSKGLLTKEAEIMNTTWQFLLEDNYKKPKL